MVTADLHDLQTGFHSIDFCRLGRLVRNTNHLHCLGNLQHLRLRQNKVYSIGLPRPAEDESSDDVDLVLLCDVLTGLVSRLVLWKSGGWIDLHDGIVTSNVLFFDQRYLLRLIRGSMTVQLTSCLFSLYFAAFLMLNEQQMICLLKS